MRVSLVAAMAGLWLLAGVCTGCSGPGGAFIEAESAAQFDQLTAAADRPVMVALYRNGCMACMATAPTLAAISTEYEGRALFVKVERSVAEVRRRYAVTGYPTVVLLVAGREYARWMGESNRQSYRDALDRALLEKRFGP